MINNIEEILRSRIATQLTAHRIIVGVESIKNTAGFLEPIVKDTGQMVSLEGNSIAYLRRQGTVDTQIIDNELSEKSYRSTYRWRLVVSNAEGLTGGIMAALNFENVKEYRTTLNASGIWCEAGRGNQNSDEIFREEYGEDRGITDTLLAFEVAMTIQSDVDCSLDTCNDIANFCPSLQQVLADNDPADIEAALEANNQLDAVCGEGCDLNTLVDESTDAQVATAIELAGKEVTILDNLFALSGVTPADIYSAAAAEGQIDGIVPLLSDDELDNLITAQLNYVTSILTSVQIQLLSDGQLDNLTQAQLNGLVPNMGATQWALLSSGQKAAIISILTGCEVSTSLPQAQKNDVNYRSSLPFSSILSCNNIFGNTNRFTDELGGQTYTNNIVIDHLLNLYVYRLPQTSATHANAIINAAALNVGGVSGWRLPTAKEIMQLWQDTFGNKLNYAPINYSASANHWTATDGATSAQAQTYNPNAPSLSTTSKAGSNIYLAVKTYLT